MTHDQRPRPPTDGQERETLQGFLDFQRATLVWKVGGVSDADARKPLLASSPDLTLCGIVKHLTAVERGWFRIVVAAEPVENLATRSDPKAMTLGDGEHIDELITRYQQECSVADRAVASMRLDDVARLDGRTETLRWVLCHMIEETARHNGHADLLRESIDGVTGE